MPVWIAIVGAAIAAAALLYFLLSTVLGRRQARQQEKRLRPHSVDELERMITKCDYFDFEPKGSAPLRSTPEARQFLLQVSSGKYDAALSGLDASFTELVAAERRLGHQGRPMLIDYDQYLRSVLEELASRTREKQ